MSTDLSPRRLARIGGLLYLIVIVIGVLGEAVVRGGVVVAGDASATAANLETCCGRPGACVNVHERCRALVPGRATGGCRHRSAR